MHYNDRSTNLALVSLHKLTVLSSQIVMERLFCWHNCVRTYHWSSHNWCYCSFGFEYISNSKNQDLYFWAPSMKMTAEHSHTQNSWMACIVEPMPWNTQGAESRTLKVPEVAWVSFWKQRNFIQCPSKCTSNADCEWLPKSGSHIYLSSPSPN